jgi:hypothetical protein
MEAGLYNFQLPKSGDVSNVMTGIAFVAAVTHGEPGEEAEGEGAADIFMSKPVSQHQFYTPATLPAIGSQRMLAWESRMWDLPTSSVDGAISWSPIQGSSAYIDQAGSQLRFSDHWGPLAPGGDPFHGGNIYDRPVNYLKQNGAVEWPAGSGFYILKNPIAGSMNYNNVQSIFNFPK